MNAVVYDAKNGRLYSGDGIGAIVVWRRANGGRGRGADYSVLRKVTANSNVVNNKKRQDLNHVTPLRASLTDSGNCFKRVARLISCVTGTTCGSDRKGHHKPSSRTSPAKGAAPRPGTRQHSEAARLRHLPGTRLRIAELFAVGVQTR